MPIEREPRVGGDGGAHERPGQNSQQVSEQKTKDEVSEHDAVKNKKGADHKFRCRHVLAGEESREVAARLQLV